MSIDLAFLFIDDSHHPATKLYSLTGILVPVRKYKGVRDDFYAMLRPFIQTAPDTINLAPPELHGRDLLPGHSDDEKVRVLTAAVAIIKAHSLRVLRVGAPDEPDMREIFKTETNFYGWCWAKMIELLQETLATTMVVPVMDSTDDLERIARFSFQGRFFETMRTVGMEPSVTIRNTDNLIGEVFYADSRFASMIQLADLVSYLLTQAEASDMGGPSTAAFKQQAVAIAQDLPTDLIERQRVGVRISRP